MTDIIIPIIVLIAAGGGVYLGHYVTLKGVAHVQPSSEKLVFDIKQANATTEPDPWDEAMYGETPDESRGPDEQHSQDSTIDKLKEMGLNTGEMEESMEGAASGGESTIGLNLRKAEMKMTGSEAGGMVDEA